MVPAVSLAHTTVLLTSARLTQTCTICHRSAGQVIFRMRRPMYLINSSIYIEASSGAYLISFTLRIPSPALPAYP